MKKMRRLIPAFAMLLVSAIMLSTASFAWFTMNEQVTATGMSVQAQAAGNLVIHTSALTAANQEISVDLSSTTLKYLKPITYHEVTVTTTPEGGESTTSQVMKWQTANDGTQVDSLYGNVLGGTLADVTPTATPGDYFQDYTVYIATAGQQKEDQDIYVKINGLSGVDQDIAEAYTIAFWVLPVDGTPDWTTPTSVVNYETALANATTGVRINTAKTLIPSTDGVGVDEPVGVKIVMRVYVDGGLVSGTHEVKTRTYNPVVEEDGDATTWGAFKTSLGADFANTVIYTLAGGVYSEVDTATWLDTKAITENDGYYYAITTEDETENVPTHYVNNQSVPTASTNFAVVFSIEDSNLQ